jgi:N-acetyl-gamma-glutamyl-phosphate reductase
VARLRAAVVGATGYAGAELVRILSGHPDVDLTLITSRKQAGHDYDTIYPALKKFVRPGLCRQRCGCGRRKCRCGLSGFAPQSLHGYGSRIAGCRAAGGGPFRGFPVQESRRPTKPITSPTAVPTCWKTAVYGLCERFADQIAKADLIGNPGCYPTSVLLPLLPLVEAGLLEPTALWWPIASPVSAGPAGKPRRRPIFATSTNRSSHTRSAAIGTRRK